ncbi:MAG TPA: folylpolyglutamate synthase/dihydrofolate synthase family protein [Solirubrobacteraceae bacterium]|jgi:dihydrofolate synthase/folylpolyglutamate synthase|nr:folylpolyglutamate synthase/dihydrofolate synthase family protein [Solirubrobacteraceae bacterium]
MSLQDAERLLLSRELFGMRFGLERMQRLLTALGHPEQRFDSIHVVGTNGKSSTTRMTAAILAAHGRRVGAYLSPHLVSFAERIRIGDEDLEPQAFADAVQRAVRAAELVERSLDEGDRVTQFELLTAAAFSELARRGVEVAVIEAGLGGRYDATNVLPSRVQVLTGVGLEHTRWLGPTITAIAREKLDVVRPGGTIVLGAGLHPDADAVAVEVAHARGATIIRAGSEPGVAVGALGGFQRRNFALARAAADAFLGALDPAAVAAAAAGVRVPGRLQIVDHDPLTLIDGAHNPDGIAAVAESLPALMAGPPPRKRLVAVISILDDKDAAGMLANLIPVTDALVFTASQNPRALPPPTLQSLASQVGARDTELVRDPVAAVARARELAGPDGLVLATGSIYLVGDLLAPVSDDARPRRASRL